jgi:phosphoglycerol transferase MdoB-like AlkP superfamily enzyme
MNKYFFFLKKNKLTSCKTLRIILLFFFLQQTLTIVAQKRPNIIFILTDQWRSSAFGYAGNTQVKTPNIDKFASESVNFQNCVSVDPVCTPYIVHRS